MIQDSLFRAGSSLFIVDREFVHNPLKLPIELDPGAATFGQNPRNSQLISLLAALVGIPHRTLGEEPGAVVTLKLGAEATEAELREFVTARLAALQGAGESRILARAAATRTARSSRTNSSSCSGREAKKEAAARATPAAGFGRVISRWC